MRTRTRGRRRQQWDDEEEEMLLLLMLMLLLMMMIMTMMTMMISGEAWQHLDYVLANVILQVGEAEEGKGV